MNHFPNIPGYGGPSQPGFYSAIDFRDRAFRNGINNQYGSTFRTNPAARMAYGGGSGGAGGARAYQGMQNAWMGMQRPNYFGGPWTGGFR